MWQQTWKYFCNQVRRWLNNALTVHSQARSHDLLATWAVSILYALLPFRMNMVSLRELTLRKCVELYIPIRVFYPHFCGDRDTVTRVRSTVSYAISISLRMNYTLPYQLNSELLLVGHYTKRTLSD